MKPLFHRHAITGLVAILDHTDTRNIERRLKLANERERGRSSYPDGQPAGRTTDGGGSGSNNDSSVERVTLARIEHTPDPYRRTLDEANTALETAVDATRELEAKLNKLDKLQQNPDLGEPGCEAMAIVEVWEPVHRNTDVNGKKRALGRWAYRFVGVTGRMPTRDECERHAAGKRIRVKVEGEVVQLT